MVLLIDGHTFQYEMECLSRMFFPYDKVPSQQVDAPWGEEYIYTALHKSGEEAKLTVQVRLADTEYREEQQLPHNADLELTMAQMLYRQLGAATGVRLRWGVLTGIRPVRLVHTMRRQGMTDPEITRRFRDDYFVSQEKIELVLRTAEHEIEIIQRSERDSYSLYVSIPFCPTRCHYCSFVSHSIEKTKKLMEPYVEKLCEELRLTGQIARELGLRLQTIYFGGGTPTTLSAEQLTRLFCAIEESFERSGVCEYTVEAGRPDTITLEKLEAIYRAGVDRISINPQTMNDGVLEAIGRRHTSQETLQAFRLARQVGFDNINMDLIAGLPTDTVESFQSTIDRVMELAPENVTLHTLSVKRAADLARRDPGALREEQERVGAMLEYAYRQFYDHGYEPYYLYRQKNMLGNMENVGFARPGKEGVYNVYIMDETHTILAAGAGGVTKLRQPGGDKIERIFNFKYPYEYLSRYDDILTRKRKVSPIYERWQNN